MTLPNSFSTVTQAQGSWLDENFAALGAITPIPCTVTGTNTLTLTPLANAPSITAYSALQLYCCVAAHTNTGATTAGVGSLAGLSVYKDTSAGPAALAGGEIVIGNFVALAYDAALNAGAGGFHLVAPMPTPAVPAAAHAQKVVATPTAPASTSAYAMQGLAGSITPARTGTVLITISGTIIAPTGTTAGLGINYQIAHGTGAAPSNADAATGTAVGAVQTYTHSATVTAADVHIPFSVQAVVTGLTVGVAAWIDLQAESVTTASDIGLAAVSVSAIEL